MSVEKIQERVNEAADKEAWNIIHCAFAPAKAVCKSLRARFPKAPNWELSFFYVNVYCAELKGTAAIRVDEGLLRLIEAAIFAEIREHARQVHTDEFLAKVSAVIP